MDTAEVVIRRTKKKQRISSAYPSLLSRGAGRLRALFVAQQYVLHFRIRSVVSLLVVLTSTRWRFGPLFQWPSGATLGRAVVVGWGRWQRLLPRTTSSAPYWRRILFVDLHVIGR